MTTNKSTAIVAVVAILLIAFAVPTAIVAMKDTTEEMHFEDPIYKLDFNVEKLKNDDQAQAVMDIYTTIGNIGWAVASSGVHVGSDEPSSTEKTLPVLEEIRKALTVNCKIICLEGDVDESSTLADRHSFALIYE